MKSSHKASAFPRLTEFSIRDYRSCIDTSFSLQPDLSVFIGANASGKTNVMFALLLLRQLSRSYSRRNSGSAESIPESSVNVGFRIDGKAISLSARLKVDTDETNHDDIVGSQEIWFGKEFSKRKIKQPVLALSARYLGLYPNSSRHANYDSMSREARYSPGQAAQLVETFGVPPKMSVALARISSWASAFKYFSASQFTDPTQCPISFEVEKSVTGFRPSSLASRDARHQFLFDLFMQHESPTRSNFSRYFSIVGPSGIGLIDGIHFEKVIASSVDIKVKTGGKIRKSKRQRLLIVPQFKISKNKLSPSQLSEGTFKTLALLFYIMNDRGSVTFIEEPEVCVHHGLLSTIVDLIISHSKRKQFIISTHSDFVLDYVSPRNIYFVSRTRKVGTKVANLEAALSPAASEALKKFLRSEGSLGEYWRHGALTI